MTSNTWATRAQSRSRTFLTLARTAPSSSLSKEQGREPEWCANCFCYVCDAPASRVAPCGLSTAWRRTHRLCGSSTVGRVGPVRERDTSIPSQPNPEHDSWMPPRHVRFGFIHSGTHLVYTGTLLAQWQDELRKCEVGALGLAQAPCRRVLRALS
eukprot:CAMPEP_0181215618 /NCGR_PEP_ID=MMETSP1096-20121128/26111_1 /TAXON_ID=156174 ORGANISM="Chrysochromulina ericina, Strain CCMP281" /NCGR_SAMPLE_ID=MMETSP1096 /ASSEMBLY_ACC=CAM_ASM_000453 /LENGTH=154 /DNA_ID=CAMNT_0023307489 /DNA_START=158 /DNA_END=622 /DNA_ORIENTATION=+